MDGRKWYKTTGVIDDDEVIMHAFMSVCACSSPLPVTAGSATTLPPSKTKRGQRLPSPSVGKQTVSSGSMYRKEGL